MRKEVLRFLGLATALCVGGCGTPGQDLQVKVPAAPRVDSRVLVGEEVGRLLSPDPETSKAAEKRLIALTGEDRESFLTYARTLQGEHDPRLLNVLDEHQALPPLDVEDRLDFLLWKAALPERFYLMKSQSRLIDLARTDPDPMIARVRRDAPGSDVLGVVLAITKTMPAVPALIERYRSTGNGRSRAAAAEALGLFAGEEFRPRPSGSGAEIARDAAALEAWYRDEIERLEDAQAMATDAVGGDR
jgi:hypothetical protein